MDGLLDVRIDHKTILEPRLRLDTRIGVEIPASLLAPRFRDKEREFVPFELVDHKDPASVRFVGQLDLRPLFGIQYVLKEFGPKGQQSPVIIEAGSAIEEILEAVGMSMKAAGADPVSTAVRHGQIYETAKTRLPYGSLDVDLTSGFTASAYQTCCSKRTCVK